MRPPEPRHMAQELRLDEKEREVAEAEQFLGVGQPGQVGGAGGGVVRRLGRADACAALHAHARQGQRRGGGVGAGGDEQAHACVRLHVLRVRGQAADVDDEAAVAQQGIGHHGDGGLALVEGGQSSDVGLVQQVPQCGLGLGVHRFRGCDAWRGAFPPAYSMPHRHEKGRVAAALSQDETALYVVLRSSCHPRAACSGAQAAGQGETPMRLRAFRTSIRMCK